MKHPIVRSIASIACLYGALIPQAAHAGWIKDRIDEWNTPQPSSIPNPRSDTQLSPINREGFGYVNELGGGTNEDGSYQQPVPTRDAFGSDLQDGTYVAPAAWDDDLSIEYPVQNGAIQGQHYRFNGRRF